MKRGAVAGMVGPLVFIATFTLEGWLRPGYDAKRMFISALSLGPRGWIQIANFVVLGAMLFMLSRAVAACFREGKASRAGHVLLAIIAVAFFASGPLVMDPMGTAPDQMTLHGILHGLFGALVFSLAPVTCFVFWRRFRDDAQWRSLEKATLAAGVITTLGIIALRFSVAPGSALESRVGAIQRVTIITFLLWIAALSHAIYRRCHDDDPRSPRGRRR